MVSVRICQLESNGNFSQIIIRKMLCSLRSGSISLAAVDLSPKVILNQAQSTLDFVSVIIPTYNRAERVGKAIESVLGQTHANIELIVVDDGSTDHTSSVLGQFPTISVIRQDNQGQGAARQAGLESAKGKYIASLDSDDFWNPHFISQSLSALKQTNAVFSFANWTTQTPEGQPLPVNALDMASFMERSKALNNGIWHSLDGEATRRLVTEHSPAPSSSLLVDRNFITHGWRSSFRISDDWALLLDIVLGHPGSTCAFSIEPLWTKQIDGTNIYDRHFDSVALSKNTVYDLEKLLIIHRHHLSETEVANFEMNIRSSRIDLTYAQSTTEGHKRAAIGSGLRCFREQPNWFTTLLLVKSIARSSCGLRR
jgi:glycosyltransferase involved in cell wall biosynthesis